MPTQGSTEEGTCACSVEIVPTINHALTLSQRGLKPDTSSKNTSGVHCLVQLGHLMLAAVILYCSRMTMRRQRSDREIPEILKVFLCCFYNHGMHAPIQFTSVV